MADCVQYNSWILSLQGFKILIKFHCKRDIFITVITIKPITDTTNEDMCLHCPWQLSYLPELNWPCTWAITWIGPDFGLNSVRVKISQQIYFINIGV